MVQGTPTLMEDQGPAGDVRINGYSVMQTLVWQPLSYIDAEAMTDQMWGGMVALQVDGAAALEPSAVTKKSGKIAGQRGVKSQAVALGNPMYVAVWPCPKAGVLVTLLTEGKGADVLAIHQASLKSAACGARPPPIVQTTRPYVFQGDAAEWEKQPSVDDVWLRRRDRWFLSAVQAGTDRSPVSCEQKLDTVRNATLGFEPLGPGVQRAEIPGGCKADWLGTFRDEAVRLHVESVKCGEGAYLATCMGPVDGELDCGGLLSCRVPFVPGVAAPIGMLPLAPRTLLMGSVEMIEGDVVGDQQLGDQGQFEIKSPWARQRVNWVPLEAGVDAKAAAERSWKVLLDTMLAQGAPLDADSAVFQAMTVDGQPGMTKRFVIRQSEVFETTWACPEAGVMVTMSVSGAVGGMQPTHAKAIQSVTCARARLMPAPPSYAFTGEKKAFTQPDPNTASWIRNPPGLWLWATEIGASDPRVSCSEVLKRFAKAVTVPTLDQSPVSLAETPNGCVGVWAATAEGHPMDVRLERVSCPKGGFLSTCMVSEGTSVEACEALLACQR